MISIQEDLCQPVLWSRIVLSLQYEKGYIYHSNVKSRIDYSSLQILLTQWIMRFYPLFIILTLSNTHVNAYLYARDLFLDDCLDMLLLNVW